MKPRVLSGMRPTGALHLGHYHGALRNWVRLQRDYDCHFFVADWHALTTDYADHAELERNVYDMVVDWLAAGVDPDRATLFIQSRMPEHAELFTLLAMGTPLAWLERMPSYKEHLERPQRGGRELATYGFLGYPLLQAADILIYKAAYVPVGEDQAPHVEVCREVARRFNHLYGRPPGHARAVEAALERLPAAERDRYEAARRAYREHGTNEALAAGAAVIAWAGSNVARWTSADSELLGGHLRGTGRTVLPEPEMLLTEVSRMPSLDGAKMSKSYGNAIAMRESPAEVERKIRQMPTDPQRVRREDAGDPARCPVWQFHAVYSDAALREAVREGCTSAGIGCLECKQPVIDAILREQAPWRERAEAYLSNPKHVHWIVEIGTERARTVARETLRDVREAMGLRY